MKEICDLSPKRLNEGLCPEKFRIVVPKKSRLLGIDWSCKEQWKCYLGELGVELDRREELTVDDFSCDCKEGWVLEGDLAVAHACRVHDRIHRQILTLDEVSAVDVGFALWERQAQFGDFLSIRIHVNRKRPAEQLVRQGLGSFTLPTHAFDIQLVRGARLNGREDVFVVNNLSQGRRQASPGAGDRQATTRGQGRRSGSCPQVAALRALLHRELRGDRKLWKNHGRYPVGGVRPSDLSVFCPKTLTNESTFEDIRLCISGVPIDVINAQYGPSNRHPGGDAERGVFVDRHRRSNELCNDESLRIGRGRITPLVGGVSVGTVTGQAGTLSTIVWDQTDGAPCVLSNWHVLAGTADAQVGRSTYQPALFDGGTADDVVARLKRWHLGEKGDAALAELTGDRDYASGEVLGMWHPISGYLEPALDMEVRKWGRTTGFTRGFVDGIHLATNIDYGGGVTRYFRNQFHIAPLYPGEDVSQVGDSGSLVFTSYRPLDLHRNLETAVEWLRACCTAHGVEVLCAEIRCAVDEWYLTCKHCQCDCDENQQGSQHAGACLEGCEEVCSIAGIPVSDLKKYCCDNADREALCKFLRSKKKALDEACSKVRCQVSLLECWEDCLAHLIDRYCNRVPCFSDAENGAKTVLEGLGRQIGEVPEDVRETVRALYEHGSVTLGSGETPTSELPAPIQKKLRGLTRCFEKDALSRAWCESLEEALAYITRYREGLERCLHFCARVEDSFDRWIERCEAIGAAHKLCSRICLALDVGCRELDCADPSDIVQCVIDNLAHLERGVGNPESADGNDENSGESVACDPCTTTRSEELFACVAKKLIEDLELTKAPSIGPEDLRHAIRALAVTMQLDPDVFEDGIRANARRFHDLRDDREARHADRVYYAVGMIFAGDTPGSPLGEFAVASDIGALAEELRFSLRPVFEPRSSFRTLRERPPGRRGGAGGRGAGFALGPSDGGSDPRPSGPQPEIEPIQSGSSSGGGTGGGSQAGGG